METLQPIDPAKAMARAPRNSRRTWTGEQKAVINKIFATIKVCYPHAWKDQDESMAKNMWIHHLYQHSEEKVDAVLLTMIDHHPTFPPTLGEFKKMLRLNNETKPKFFAKALPAPEPTLSIGQKHIAKMRAALR